MGGQTRGRPVCAQCAQLATEANIKRKTDPYKSTSPSDDCFTASTTAYAVGLALGSSNNGADPYQGGGGSFSGGGATGEW